MENVEGDRVKERIIEVGYKTIPTAAAEGNAAAERAGLEGFARAPAPYGTALDAERTSAEVVRRMCFGLQAPHAGVTRADRLPLIGRSNGVV
jgi:hypothetical protein